METTSPTPDTPARSCATCGSAMERHQDWCLECGTAAPGRLGAARPGWRAVSTTLALTLVLVGGAGAASYAALSSDATREAIASVPGDGTPVAQAPPAVPAPPAPVVPAPAAATPTVKAPAPKLPVAPTPAPVATPTPAPAVTPKAPGSTGGSSTATTGSDSTTRSTAAGSRGAGTNASGTSSGSNANLQPLALGADAVALYDPYGRAQNPGDPADAYDGDPGTVYRVGAPADGRELQVGVVIDLEAAKQVRGLDVRTSTPGGRVEVYATDSSTLPPDVLDTRWDHPASRSSLDRSERITFPKGGAKYRYVTLWFTTPPKSGRTVGLAELKVLG